jgi:plasminogen activator
MHIQVFIVSYNNASLIYLEKYILGCLNGAGSDYVGSANTTATGNACLSWEDQRVLMAMKYRVSEKTRRSLLNKHNKCRNPDGTDLQPWCYVQTSEGMVRSEFCDIPPCNSIAKLFRGCLQNI